MKAVVEAAETRSTRRFVARLLLSVIIRRTSSRTVASLPTRS